MQCSEFQTRASEFRDGRTKGEVQEAMVGHLAGCPRCRRYHAALDRGVALLRSLPSLGVPEDFRPRLAHRIYHLEDGGRIARESLGSGATTASVLAVAILLALAAWTPRAGVSTPSLDLPAVVAGPPPARTFTPGPRRSTFPRSPSLFTSSDFQDGPWGDAHQVLFEYSSLSGRRRAPVLSRVGVQ